MKLPCQGLVEHCDVPILLVKGEMKKKCRAKCPRSVDLSPPGWGAGKGLGVDDLVKFVVFEDWFLFQSEPQEYGEEKRVWVWWGQSGTGDALAVTKKLKMHLEV